MVSGDLNLVLNGLLVALSNSHVRRIQPHGLCLTPVPCCQLTPQLSLV